MGTPGSRDVDAAVTEMLRTLGPHDGQDWQVSAGGLRWSCWRTAAHVAHDLLAYAGQVTGHAADGYLPFDLVVRAEATPHAVLDVVGAAGGLLSGAIAGAGPGDRGWHFGACDPPGFAAMGVAETLLHTHDITRGLGVTWRPPGPLCALVLTRLFPDAPPGDPAEVLLWQTGRGALAGHPHVTSWVWHAAVP